MPFGKEFSVTMKYDLIRPLGYRGPRSLESKWGLIKHDVGKFISIYKQVKVVSKFGTSGVDLQCMSKELFKMKHLKNFDFNYFHCWLLLRSFPRWADGWVVEKLNTPTKRPTPSNVEAPDSHCAREANLDMDPDRSLCVHPKELRLPRKTSRPQNCENLPY